MKKENDKEDFMLEAFFFITVSVVLFTFIFFKMIKNNHTSYIIILIIEALGVFIDCIFLLHNQNMNIIVKSLIYLMSIILPLAIIFLEYKKLIIRIQNWNFSILLP